MNIRLIQLILYYLQYPQIDNQIYWNVRIGSSGHSISKCLVEWISTWCSLAINFWFFANTLKCIWNLWLHRCSRKSYQRLISEHLIFHFIFYLFFLRNLFTNASSLRSFFWKSSSWYLHAYANNWVIFYKNKKETFV